MFDGSDTIVLYDGLAYQDVLPVYWRPYASAIEPAVITSFTERNVRVLQACAAIEEHGGSDKPEEPSPDVQRLDLKINLLLDLVGQLLVSNHPRPTGVPIRFNALGAIWRGATPLPEAGTQGVAEIYLRDFLPDPLRLVGRITSVTPDGQIKARFNPPNETIADLMEKLIFRQHRRQVAGSRQPRRVP